MTVLSNILIFTNECFVQPTPFLVTAKPLPNKVSAIYFKWLFCPRYSSLQINALFNLLHFEWQRNHFQRSVPLCHSSPRSELHPQTGHWSNPGQGSKSLDLDCNTKTRNGLDKDVLNMIPATSTCGSSLNRNKLLSHTYRWDISPAILHLSDQHIIN